MRLVHVMPCTLAIVFAAVGCGASGDGSSPEGADPREPAVTAPGPKALAPTGAAAELSDTQAQESAPNELARIEYDDGAVVVFEELGDGVLVSERGSALNKPHLVPNEGATALDTFKALAPGRAIPAALQRRHERMYPAGATVEPRTEASRTEAPREQLELQPALQHNGEFQLTGGSYPDMTFATNFCNFSVAPPSYIHTNRTDPHTDVSSAHRMFQAIAADIGNITVQACVDVDKRPSNCNTEQVLLQGGSVTWLYDAGRECDRPAGGVQLCFYKNHRIDIRLRKITDKVRMHHCASVTQT